MSEKLMSCWTLMEVERERERERERIEREDELVIQPYMHIHMTSHIAFRSFDLRFVNIDIPCLIRKKVTNSAKAQLYLMNNMQTLSSYLSYFSTKQYTTPARPSC